MENQKRGRGRPKGSVSKNKTESAKQNLILEAKPKGKRGRPKGSKNKNSSPSKSENKIINIISAEENKDKNINISTKKAMAKNGDDYRQTAKRMREEFGFKMNHVSARNYTIRALEKIAFDLMNAVYANDVDRKNLDIHEVVQYPLFQEGIAELMRIQD